MYLMFAVRQDLVTVDLVTVYNAIDLQGMFQMQRQYGVRGKLL